VPSIDRHHFLRRTGALFHIAKRQISCLGARRRSLGHDIANGPFSDGRKSGNELVAVIFLSLIHNKCGLNGGLLIVIDHQLARCRSIGLVKNCRGVFVNPKHMTRPKHIVGRQIEFAENAIYVESAQFRRSSLQGRISPVYFVIRNEAIAAVEYGGEFAGGFRVFQRISAVKGRILINRSGVIKRSNGRYRIPQLRFRNRVERQIGKDQGGFGGDPKPIRPFLNGNMGRPRKRGGRIVSYGNGNAAVPGPRNCQRVSEDTVPHPAIKPLLSSAIFGFASKSVLLVDRA